MDQPKYRIEIFWSDEDGGYIANVPALRYCSAFGESYEEALREVLVAMELHLDTLRELDRPVPDPTSPGVSKSSAPPGEYFTAFVTYLTDQLRHDSALRKDIIEQQRKEWGSSQELAQESDYAYEEFFNSVTQAWLEQYRSEQEQSQRRTRN